MKTCLVVLALSCFCLSGSAQQYLVRYDLAAEDIRYYKIRKPGDTTSVNIIPLSSSHRVNLQLLNISQAFNRQVVLHEKAEVQETVIIPGIGTGAAGAIPLLSGQEAGRLNAEDIFRDKATDTKSVEYIERKNEFARFTTAYNNFMEHYLAWTRAIVAVQAQQRLWKELARLRYSTSYSAKEVKAQATRQVNTLFAGAASLELPWLEPPATTMAFHLEEMGRNLSVATGGYQALAGLDVQSTAADSLLLMLQQKQRQATYFTGSNNMAPDLTQRIKFLYDAIMNDSYIQVTPLPLNRKTVVAELRLTAKIDSFTAAALEKSPADTITRWIPIVKKEPLRFRNSFGFSFLVPGPERWKYYVTADSIVARQRGDHYQPAIVTLLHFYAPRDRGFRWGGSLGAGLPITGEDKQLQIMLGLSSFLGKHDPVAITAGVVASRIKQLSGVAVGDKLAAPQNALEYQLVYRTGFFISISFNPAALNERD